MSGRRVTAPVQPLAHTVEHAAAALDMSEDHFRKHVAPHVRWVRRGRKRVVAVAELERFLAENGERVLAP